MKTGRAPLISESSLAGGHVSASHTPPSLQNSIANYYTILWIIILPCALMSNLIEQALLFSKRDSCSDAFGTSRSNSICAPSATLCCTEVNSFFPSCQQFLGKGWCCVGNNATDSCYVDTASVCEETNSVTCANETEQLCCPRTTSCVPGYGGNGGVRCQILYTDLVALAVSSTASTTTTTSISSTQSTTTSVTTSPPVTSTTVSSSRTLAPAEFTNMTNASSATPSLSSGAIAGIVSGMTAVIIIAALVVYWRLRRRRDTTHHRRRVERSVQEHPPNAVMSYEPEVSKVKYDTGTVAELSSEQVRTVQYRYELDT